MGSLGVTEIGRTLPRAFPVEGWPFSSVSTMAHTDLRFWWQVLTTVSPAQIRELTGHAENWDRVSRNRAEATAEAQSAAGMFRDNSEVKQAARQATFDFNGDVSGRLVGSADQFR